eukprot:11298755-Alexandrium_andersonii.AAC.2
MVHTSFAVSLPARYCVSKYCRRPRPLSVAGRGGGGWRAFAKTAAAAAARPDMATWGRNRR